MKVHRRRIFRIRRQVAVLVCAASILALPALASARPAPADNPSGSTAQPVVFHPSPSERVTDYRAPDFWSAPEPTVTVVHNNTDGRTLAIVLSGSALLVALMGSGYVLVRLRHTPAGGLS